MHSREPATLARAVGLRRMLAVELFLVNGVLAPLLGPIGAALFIADAWNSELLAPRTTLALLESWVWCSVLVIGALCALWPSALGLRARGLGRNAWALTLLPFYYALLGVAAWLALWELQRRPFYWAKTHHGVGRRGKRRPPTR